MTPYAGEPLLYFETPAIQFPPGFPYGNALTLIPHQEPGGFLFMSEWIKSNTDLADHPKTYVLSSTLSVPVPYVIGTLHLLWYFTLRFAWEDGDLTKFGPIAVARACQWDKDPDVLISALQCAHFLDGMRVHDWHDFAGRLVKDRIRYKQHNVRNTDVIRTEPVSKSRVEKSRVYKSFTPPTPEELLSYAKEKNYNVDLAEAERFINFYESKGWVVGKSPMKNWKSSLSNWVSRKSDVDGKVKVSGGAPSWMTK